jgi:hypothetical protein
VQGLPLVKPPYSRVTAIDLDNGTFRWQVPFGATPDAIRNHPALKGLNLPPMGRQGLNPGTLVTKTLLIAGENNFGPTPSGARGAMLRALDKMSGKEVGAVYMPAPQSGSPMTYMLNGSSTRRISGAGVRGELVAFRLGVNGGTSQGRTNRTDRNAGRSSGGPARKIRAYVTAARCLVAATGAAALVFTIGVGAAGDRIPQRRRHRRRRSRTRAQIEFDGRVIQVDPWSRQPRRETRRLILVTDADAGGITSTSRPSSRFESAPPSSFRSRKARSDGTVLANGQHRDPDFPRRHRVVRRDAGRSVSRQGVANGHCHAGGNHSAA